FGTALLIAGLNDKPSLFETDPSGAFTEYTASAIGMGKSDVEKIFEKEYREGMSRSDAIDLALKGLNSVSEEKLKTEYVEIITIEFGKMYQEVSREEIDESMKRIIK
ncbi:MAG: proteasome subunit alpha, partial [Candidatus Altiarchaeales archaeon]